MSHGQIRMYRKSQNKSICVFWSKIPAPLSSLLSCRQYAHLLLICALHTFCMDHSEKSVRVLIFVISQMSPLAKRGGENWGIWLLTTHHLTSFPPFLRATHYSNASSASSN